MAPEVRSFTELLVTLSGHFFHFLDILPYSHNYNQMYKWIASNVTSIQTFLYERGNFFTDMKAASVRNRQDGSQVVRSSSFNSNSTKEKELDEKEIKRNVRKGKKTIADSVEEKLLGSRKRSSSTGTVSNKKKKTTEESECAGCLETHDQRFTLPCGHSYCKDCVRGFFLAALGERSLMPVRCCGKRIDQRLRRVVLNLKECAQFELALEELEAPNKLYW